MGEESDKDGSKIKKEKISTGIEGLDRLLFGGIQLRNMEEPRPLIIGVYGPGGTSKALLAMQLLHGLTKGIRCGERETEFSAPMFLTRRNAVKNLEDLLLDMLISRQTNQIIRDTITGEYGWNVCEYCSYVFDLKDINRCCLPDNVPLDAYLSEDALYYNNRTNALHIRKPGDVEGLDNLVAPRRCDTINEYLKSTEIKVPKRFTDDFFEVRIIDSVNKLADPEKEGGKAEETGGKQAEGKYNMPCFVLDGCGRRRSKILMQNVCAEEGIQSLLEDCCEKQESQTLCLPEWAKGVQLDVLIVLSDKAEEVHSWKPDICIELRTYQDPDIDYMYHQLRIRKSALQATAQGWHQYKIRDYGIEVYPSSHVILQKRRFMPRALLRTHSGVLSETFQQYLKTIERDKFPKLNGSYDPKLYKDYLSMRDKREMDKLYKLYLPSQPKDSCFSILDKIILRGSKGDFPEATVTAFVGDSNTYKRYLISGGTFSSCCRKEHVLNILLDKEDYIMLRRITCPVLALNTQKDHSEKDPVPGKYIGEHKLENCRECYRYVHFMDIRMGCISSDEFFYYLIQQLKVPIKAEGDTSKLISRIVIDDLQNVDFSFPLLKKDPLFLTTLVAICKDYHVDLFILCNKEALFAKELRTQADNVIYTKRNDDDNLSVYIERYAGYNNPSHIFACKVKEVKGLFRCAWRDGQRRFALDDRKIDDIDVACTGDFG